MKDEEMTREQALDCVDSWSKRFDGLSRSEIRQALATLRNKLEELEEKNKVLSAEIERLEKDAATGREIAVAFLPVMEAARPLVLNLERLRDAAKGASPDQNTGGVS